MLQISYKKLAWIMLLIIFVIVFFLSLWLSSRSENKILQKDNITLKAKLQEAHATRDIMVKQTYSLYEVVKTVNDGLRVQTASITNLTKSLPETNYLPIVVRDTVYRVGDALDPYRSSKDTTKSRGF